MIIIMSSGNLAFPNCSVSFKKNYVVAMTKLLVAIGRGNDFNEKRSVEVINLDQSHPNMTCENLPDYPLELEVSISSMFYEQLLRQ